MKLLTKLLFSEDFRRRPVETRFEILRAEALMHIRRIG